MFEKCIFMEINLLNTKYIHGFDSKFTFSSLFDKGDVQTTVNNAWK